MREGEECNALPDMTFAKLANCARSAASGLLVLVRRSAIEPSSLKRAGRPPRHQGQSDELRSLNLRNFRTESEQAGRGGKRGARVRAHCADNESTCNGGTAERLKPHLPAVSCLGQLVLYMPAAFMSEFLQPSIGGCLGQLKACRQAPNEKVRLHTLVRCVPNARRVAPPASQIDCISRLFHRLSPFAGTSGRDKLISARQFTMHS